MKHLIKFLVLILITCTIVSCEWAKDKQFTSSKLELRQLVKETETSSHSSGWFFFITGGYSSETTQRTYVKVFANVDGEYRYIEMPIEDIRIVINNNISTPYIQIRYTNSKQRNNNDLLEYSWGHIYVITCPEIYLPEKLLPITL